VEKQQKSDPFCQPKTRAVNFIRTQIPEVVIIVPKVFGGLWGYFFESNAQELFDKNIKPFEFVQVLYGMNPNDERVWIRNVNK
jgi:dTDP-4-dehydrorhamnose 3,5-epimerase-like enzyme